MTVPLFMKQFGLRLSLFYTYLLKVPIVNVNLLQAILVFCFLKNIENTVMSAYCRSTFNLFYYSEVFLDFQLKGETNKKCKLSKVYHLMSVTSHYKKFSCNKFTTVIERFNSSVFVCTSAWNVTFFKD